MRLAGKVALVTGAGAKMGRAVPVLFAQEGARVAVVARTEATLTETVALIRSAGGEVIMIVADTTDEGAIRDAVEQTVAAFGRLDVLYANAGGFAPHVSDVESLDSTFWDQATGNNLRGTFLAVKHTVPAIARSGGGAIITVSAAFQTRQAGNAAYAAAKDGLIGLTRNLARELWPKNIRVNCLAPGFMRLPFAGPPVRPAPADLARAGAPEDAAYAALYLASDEAAWLTGQVIEIDGGDAVMLRAPASRGM